MRRLAVIAAMMSFFLAPNVHAGRWNVGANVSLYEQYSSNVRGAVGNEPAQDAWITGVTPSLTVDRRGSRLSLQLNSQLQYRRYVGVNNQETLYPGLAASSRFDLLKNRVFVTAGARYGQQINNPSGALLLDNSILNNNRVNYQNYSAGITWQQKYGRFASSIATYTVSQTRTQSVLYSDSQAQNLSLAVNNGSSFRNIIWGMQYSQARSRYQGNLGPVYERLSANLGYRFSRKFSLIYTVGRENNRIVQQGLAADRDYTYWYITANYSPTVRTQFSARYGRRFFGETYTLSLTHRARRGNWNLAYTEDVSTRARVEAEERAFLVVDGSGQPLLDPVTGLPIVLVDLFPVLVDDSFISRNLTLTNSMRSRRTTITTGLTYTRRGYLGTDQQDDVRYSAQVSVNVNLNTRASANTTASWSRYQIPLVQQDSDVWLFGASYSHTLDKNINFFMNARYYDRQSPVVTQVQSGFSIYVGLNIRL